MRRAGPWNRRRATGDRQQARGNEALERGGQAEDAGDQRVEVAVVDGGVEGDVTDEREGAEAQAELGGHAGGSSDGARLGVAGAEMGLTAARIPF